MDLDRVEARHGTAHVVQNQRELGAAEHDPLDASFGAKSLNDCHEARLCGVGDDAVFECRAF